jgi:hypothetical protein
VIGGMVVVGIEIEIAVAEACGVTGWVGLTGRVVAVGCSD